MDVQLLDPLVITANFNNTTFETMREVNGQNTLFIYNRTQQPGLSYRSYIGFFSGGCMDTLGSPSSKWFCRKMFLLGVTGGSLEYAVVGFPPTTGRRINLVPELFPTSGSTVDLRLHDGTVYQA